MDFLNALLIFFPVSGAANPAQVLATVGASKITVEEFNKRLADLRKQTVNPPDANELLQDLVRIEIGVQEAERLKLQNDPNVKDRYKQILYSFLLEKQLAGKLEDIKVTEKDLRDYYKKYPELHLEHIVSDNKEKALQILTEVRTSKKPFADLARAYSEDPPTRETGGDLGFQTKLSLPPALYDAALAMKPGEVRGPLETRFGFHIVRLVERQAFDLADKQQIRTAVFEQKRDHIVDNYFDGAKKAYKIEINKEALKTVGQ